jgi:hypothetical protein
VINIWLSILVTGRRTGCAGLVRNPVSGVYAIPYEFIAIPLRYTRVPEGNQLIGRVNAHVDNDVHVSETFVPTQSLNPWIVLRQNPRSVIGADQVLVMVAPKIPVVVYIPVKYAQVMTGN